MSLLFSSFKPLTRRRPPELQLSESLSTYSIPGHPRARPSGAPDARLLSNSANCACLSCQVTMLLCHQWLIVCLHLPLVWVFKCLIFELYKCVVLRDNWVVLRRCLVRCSIPLLTNQATLVGIVDHCVFSSCKHIELVSLHDSIIGQVGCTKGCLSTSVSLARGNKCVLHNLFCRGFFLALDKFFNSINQN